MCSWWWVAAALDARFEALWLGLTDLFFFTLFSSAGGEGKLCDTIVFCSGEILCVNYVVLHTTGVVRW